MLATAAVGAGVIAAGLLIARSDSPPAPNSIAAPLVVGDGRTVTLISLGGAATDPVLSRVAADIGPAVAQVEGFWGTDWSHEILVVATASDAQFAAQAAGMAGGDSTDIAAVAVADEVDPSRGLVIGQRIVLAPGAARMGDPALRIVLGHELFHYAARATTALDAPRWLTEGVADYVGRPATAVPPQDAVPAALPSDAEFDSAGSQLSTAYDRAWLFARFVADRYGVATLRRLYQQACGPGHPDLPAVLRAVLGAGPADVLVGWQRWLAAPPGIR